jgi:TPR repeat protein
MSSVFKKIKKESFFEQAKISRSKGDYTEYISILEDGHENGDQDCTYLLACCYHLGFYNIKVDCKVAFNLFENNHGHIKSLAKLAKMLKYGIGCKIDNNKVKKIGEYILKTDDNHFAKAYCIYHELGVKDEYDKSKDEFILASNEENDDESHIYLGLMSLMDDPTKTRELYLKAEMQGNPEAAEYIGELYQFGVGVERNTEIAYDWFKKSFKIQGKKSKLLHFLDIDRKNYTEDLINSKIDDKIITFHLKNWDYYSAWWFWKKSKTYELTPSEKKHFEGYTNCHKAKLTLLCISKYCRIFPKDIWILLSKYIWNTKHDREWTRNKKKIKKLF